MSSTASRSGPGNDTDRPTATLDEFDLDFEGIPVHCWHGGHGMPLVLLHGSGAGCATLSNFRAVLRPLAERYRVLAADLVGFGQSGRKPAPPYFDMALWERQARALVDYFDGAPVGLIGHSLAGSIVLRAAIGNPRVAGVVTTGTAGRTHIPNSGGPGWRYTNDPDGLRKGIERTLYDKTLIDGDEIARRLAVLNAPGYRDYFDGMFSASKAELVVAMALSDDELRSIACPVTFVHGMQDASFAPEDTSLPMARLVPNADALVLNRCAHSVALEHPDKFIAAVDMTFGGGRLAPELG